MAGSVRLRRNQLGLQSVIGTPVPATRWVPWRGVPTLNPNRTQPDVDEGSYDPIQRPYPTALDVEWNPTGPLDFDNLPYRLSAGLLGGVTPTGAVAKTWAYQLASLTSDPFAYFTLDHGDDTTATYGQELFGGVADTLEETMPEDLGPWTFSDSWVFAGANLATDRTAGLTLEDEPAYVFGADTDITIDTVPGAIGVTPISDALHGATIRIQNNLDRKRYANGSNGRFQLRAFGRTERVIEFVLTFAKSAAVIAEANTIDDSAVPSRFIQVRTVATENVPGSSTPYSYIRRAPTRLFSVDEGEIGGNTTLILTYRAFLDPTLAYAYRAVVVNGLSSL